MRIFISYSHADAPFVAKVVTDLKKRCAEIDIWFDALKLDPGASIVRSLEDAITTSDYFLVMLSPSSVRSRWVREELSAAFIAQLEGKGTYIIPILVEPCSIPSLIADRRRIDLGNNYESGIEELAHFLATENKMAASSERRLTAALEALQEPPSFAPNRTRTYYLLHDGVVRLQDDNTVCLFIKRNNGSTQKVLIDKHVPLRCLVDDLAKEIGVAPSKLVLVHKEKATVLAPAYSPDSHRLTDGNSLIVVYYDEAFHTYSLVAELGRPVESPNKLGIQPAREDAEAPVLVRGFLYALERFALGKREPRILRGLNLTGEVFANQDLALGNLSGATLAGADFHRANLQGADLSFANLRGADVRGADLRAACLSFANVALLQYDAETRWDKANLGEALGLPPADIEEIKAKGARFVAGGMFAPVSWSSAPLVASFILGYVGVLYLSAFCAIEGSMLVLGTRQGTLWSVLRFVIGAPIFLTVLVAANLPLWDTVFYWGIVKFSAVRVFQRLVRRRPTAGNKRGSTANGSDANQLTNRSSGPATPAAER